MVSDSRQDLTTGVEGEMDNCAQPVAGNSTTPNRNKTTLKKWPGPKFIVTKIEKKGAWSYETG